MKQFFKKLVKHTLALFFGLLLVLQIPTVNTPVVQGILNILTPADLKFRIKGIHGSFPFNVTIEKIKIKDNGAKWLEIQNASLDWHGADILYGNIHLRHVSADKVIYLKNPDMETSPGPMRLPRLNIDSIHVDQVEIPLLYQGSFQADGRIESTNSSHHKVRLDLGFLPASGEKDRVTYEQTGINYTLKAKTNRPITDFASLSPQFLKTASGQISVNVDVKGDTNFNGAYGQADVKLTKFECSNTKINEILGDDTAFHFNAQSDDNSSFKNAQIQVILKDRVVKIDVSPENQDELNLTGVLKSKEYNGTVDGVIHLTEFIKLTLKGTGGQVSGEYNLKSGEIDHIDLEFKQLSGISGFLFFPIWGAATLTGSWLDDSKQLNLDAMGLSFNGKSELIHVLEVDITQKKGIYDLLAKAENDSVKAKVSLSSDPEFKNISVDTLYLKSIHDETRLLELKKSIQISESNGSYKVNDTEIHFLEGGLKTKNLVLSASPSGSVSLTGFNAKILNSIIEGTQWQGELQGSIDLGGKNLYECKFNIKDFGLESGQRKREKFLNANFVMVHDRTKIDGKLFYTDSVGSKIDGAFKVKTEALFPDDHTPILTSLTGIMDLSALNTIVWWGDRFKGKLRFNLKGEGDIKSPNVKGNLVLDDGYYENGTIGTLIKEIKGKLSLSDGKLTIHECKGRDYNKGTFGITGRVDFATISSPLLDLHLSLNKIMIANTHEAIVEISGKLDCLTQKAQHHLIKGAIVVDSALINLNQVSSEPKTIRTYRTIEELNRKKAKKVTESLTQVDIKVDIPKKLLVQGFGLRSEWKGNMTVTGPINIPNVAGGIHSLKGRLDISSKRLLLGPSSVTFETTHGEIFPVLDVKATKLVHEYETFISVKGPADDPKIDFTSIPAQSPENVIALILFDKPLGEVSAAQSLQLATTLAAVKTGKFTGGSLDSLNQLLGVDDISLNKQENLGGVDDENSHYSLSVGKQLSEGVFIGIDQGLQQEVGTKFKAKIDVSKHTKIEAEAGTQNTAVGYGIEFRY